MASLLQQFVIAGAVGHRLKVDVYMAQALKRDMRGRAFDVIPMAISGCGTLNELLFYERLGRAFHPDMIVVVVPNDPANNSSCWKRCACVSTRCTRDAISPSR